MEEITLDTIYNIKVYQRKYGYRFSIDSVLLAKFVKISKKIQKIADIGAGCGIIGLIIAKTYPWLKVDLYEVQESLVELCKMNVILNNLNNRVEVFKYDITKLNNPKITQTYDAIVTNPPFRKIGSGKISPIDEKAIARHEIKLTLQNLMKKCVLLLKNKGKIFIIYDTTRMAELLYTMRLYNLEPKRLKLVYPKKGYIATMVLVEGIKYGGIELKVEPPIFLTPFFS